MIRGNAGFVTSLRRWCLALMVLAGGFLLVARTGSAAGGDESMLRAEVAGCMPGAHTPGAAPAGTSGEADAGGRGQGDKSAPTGDSPTASDLWNMSIRTYPLCAYPAGAQWRAWKQFQTVPRSAVVGWRHQTAVPNPTLPDGTGQTPWSSIGPIGTHDRYFDFWHQYILYSGRVTGLAVDPANHNILYAGTSSGGVWKTIDNGAHWSPLTDAGSPSAWIGAVAVDPNNHNVILAGTGDGAAFDGASSPGAGLLRSADGGKTWTVIRPDPTGADPFDKVGFARIVPDPAIKNRIWAITVDHGSYYWNASSAGLYRSDNDGLTWISVSGTATSHLPLMSAFDLAFDPTNPRVMYVTLTDVLHNAAPGGIYRSADGGQTWQSVQPLGSLIRSQLAIIKPAGGKPILYASQASVNWGDPSLNGHILSLSQTTDGGKTWASLTAPTGKIYPNTNILAADPTDPTGKTLYQGGVDLVKSTDGGMNWTDITTWPFTNRIYTHADNHAFIFAGSRFWVGNDGGIFWSDNRATTFHEDNDTLDLTQFYSAATDTAYTPQIIGGTQDNGTQGWTGNVPSLRWDELYGGDGGATAIDLKTPSTMYEEYVYLDIKKSVDSGRTWNNSTNGITDNYSKATNNACFIAPFVMDSIHPATLLAATGAVWQTTDAAASWHPVSSALVNGGECLSSLAIAPGNHAIWYAGSSAGHMFRTDNAGGKWLDISTGLRWGIVLSIAVDPRNAHIVYASMSNCFDRNCLFKSTNGGATWQPLSGTTNLPRSPIFSLVVDPADSNHIYLGGEQGAFESLNSGASWTLLSRNLPVVPVYRLALNPSGTILFAATYGRGMWRLYRTWIVLSPALVGKAIAITGHGFVAGKKVALTVAGIAKPAGTADRNGMVVLNTIEPAAGAYGVVLTGMQSARVARATIVVK